MESKQSGIEMDVDTDIDTENGQLIEIPFSDEVPIDDNDDESSQYTADDIDTMDPIPVEMALCIFTGHSDSVYRAAVNPKIPGQIISGGGDDKGFLFRYNCSNGDQPGSGNVIEQIELLGHKDTVTSVGFNFDGTLALTGSYDGTVRIWNTMNGSLLQVLEGPEDIEWAEFHSKGNAVLAGSKDGTVWMWMAHNGQCVQVFAGIDFFIPSFP